MDEKEIKRADGTNPRNFAHPRVFISYSHDSPEHKEWVKKLAERLMVEGGISIILDIWETEGGDDLAQFMIQSVTKAKRVIMVCSIPYVIKADEGRGGVGFETQIVTGEMIEDLGSKKFIPVIPPGNCDARVPILFKTKKYIDLRDSENFESNFDDLVKTIRDIAIFDKPQIGISERFLRGNDIRPLAPISAQDKDCAVIFQRAHEIIRSNDLIAWRDLFRSTLRRCREELLVFRKEKERNFDIENYDDASRMVADASAIFGPVMAISLAGIASEVDKFKNQLGVISDILNPDNWQGSGKNILVDLPKALTFIYQGLNGALCIQTEQIDLAYKLLFFPIVSGYRNGDARPLFLHHELTSHIESLGRNAHDCIKFLNQLPQVSAWNWLLELFGNLKEYQASLSSYYVLLALSDVVRTISNSNNNEWYFSVLPLFWFSGYEVSDLAIQKVLGNIIHVSKLWKDKGISIEQLSKGWQEYCKKWSEISCRYAIEETQYNYNKLIDLIAENQLLS